MHGTFAARLIESCTHIVLQRLITPCFHSLDDLLELTGLMGMYSNKPKPCISIFAACTYNNKDACVACFGPICNKINAQ